MDKPQFELNQDFGVKPIVKKENNKRFFGVVKKFFGSIFRGFCAVLYPSNLKCICCGRDLPTKQNVEICTSCLSEINFIAEEHSCWRCGAVITGQGHFCTNCISHSREFDICRSVAVYEGVVQQLIHGFKFGDKPYLSRTLGLLMADKIKKLGWQFDSIVPVPISASRLKERGYNQSILLAQTIAKQLDMPVSEVLSKVRDTHDQVGLNFSERQDNLKGSIVLNDKQEVFDKVVLLIDDVMTTGATANICAQVLKKAKAKRVLVFTFAHAIVKIPTEKNDETK